MHDNIPHVRVRGVLVPKEEIDQLSRMHGATLVPDSAGNILAVLDTALADYRVTHGRDPDMIDLMDDPGHHYKHVTLNVNVLGNAMPVRHKPAWFRFRRIWHMGMPARKVT